MKQCYHGVSVADCRAAYTGWGEAGETKAFYPGPHLARDPKVGAPASLSKNRNTLIEQSS